MSRSAKDGRRSRNRRTREYTGRRSKKGAHAGGYPIAGRVTKTLTHRNERRQAKRSTRVAADDVEERIM